MDPIVRLFVHSLISFSFFTGLVYTATLNSRQTVPSWINIEKRQLVADDSDYASDDYPVSQPDWGEYDYKNPDCPECEIRRIQMETQLNEQEIKKIHLEIIKKQILRKLRLSSPPNITRRKIPALPLPFMAKELSTDYQATSADNKDIEDFYGQTSQAILFANQIISRCYSHLNAPTGCFQFDFTNEMRGKDIASAELWAYKKPDPGDVHNQTFLVSELKNHQNRNVKSRYPLNIIHTNRKQQWMRFDITKSIRTNMKTSAILRNPTFRITCKTCRGDPGKNPVFTTRKHRPFLVINFAKSVKKRTRRSPFCNGVGSECCMEPLYVNFSDIGWDNWIRAPAGYSANYCRGSCHAINRDKITRFHAGLMQNIGLQETDPVRKADIMPCCTPTKMRSQSLIYTTENDNSILKVTVPNMIAEACGCS